MRILRAPVIAGNWKMNNTIVESLELVKALHYGMSCPPDVEVIVAPPYTSINKVAEFLKKSFIKVSGQDIFWEDSGAYTGAISGIMLKEAGADYAIVGHSERRQYFAETDFTVHQKVKACFNNDIIPIVCVGETLGQRESGQMQEVVTYQVTEALRDLKSENVASLIIAYEPVWAIGTGKTASPEQVEEVHVMIRNILQQQFGNDTAQKTRILYGGSVKASNSKELLGLPNVDGALVGGASLKAAEFIQIIRSLE